MKVAFLTLLLALVCGAREAPTETEITGDWRTIYLATDNQEKIEEGGPLRVYFRHFECIDNCERLSVTFNLKVYINCTLMTVEADRREGNVYVANYMGENAFELIHVSENTMLFSSENFDGVKKTKVNYALGKGDSLTEEDFQKFQEVNSERGIPNENIVDATKTDDCPL